MKVGALKIPVHSLLLKQAINIFLCSAKPVLTLQNHKHRPLHPHNLSLEEEPATTLYHQYLRHQTFWIRRVQHHATAKHHWEDGVREGSNGEVPRVVSSTGGRRGFPLALERRCRRVMLYIRDPPCVPGPSSDLQRLTEIQVKWNPYILFGACPATSSTTCRHGPWRHGATNKSLVRLMVAMPTRRAASGAQG